MIFSTRVDAMSKKEIFSILYFVLVTILLVIVNIYTMAHGWGFLISYTLLIAISQAWFFFFCYHKKRNFLQSSAMHFVRKIILISFGGYVTFALGENVEAISGVSNSKVILNFMLSQTVSTIVLIVVLYTQFRVLSDR